MDHRTAASLLSRLHEAQNAMYGGGDVEPVKALLTSDVRWHVPGQNAIAGTYEGLEEVVGYFTRRRELAGHTLALHPGELLVGDGHHIASLTDGSAVVEGREHRWSTVGLYRVVDGRIAECWLLPLDAAAFDQAWTAAGEDTPVPQSPGDGAILVVTGPPGVGKTTAARALTRSADRAVHLEADSFFHFIQGGYIPPWQPESHEQNAFVMGLVADAAAAYAREGYRTVVEGVLAPGWFLGPVLARLRSTGHDVSCVILDAPLEVCRARLAGRADPEAPDGGVIAQLWEGFRELGELDCQVLDTGSLSPTQAAGELAQHW
jgi:predicted kinase/ketosteroid isomerase-like protein